MVVLDVALQEGDWSFEDKDLVYMPKVMRIQLSLPHQKVTHPRLHMWLPLYRMAYPHLLR